MRHKTEKDWFQWVLTMQGVDLVTLEASEQDRSRTFFREDAPGIPPVYTLGEIIERWKELR